MPDKVSIGIIGTGRIGVSVANSADGAGQVVEPACDAERAAFDRPSAVLREAVPSIGGSS